MQKITEALKGLPEDVIRWVAEQYSALPWPARARLEQVLARLPGSSNSVLRVFRNVGQLAKGALDQSSVRVAVVGPVGTGKSTLLNVLTGRTVEGFSKTPSVPDVQAGCFVVVDAPSDDDAGFQSRLEQVLATVRGCDLAVFVFDATFGIEGTALGLYREMRALGKPVVAVMNKVDLLERDEEEGVVSAAERLLGVRPLPISALEGRNVGKLLRAMVSADSRVVNAVAALLPVHRREVAWSRIKFMSAVAAGIGLEPLPLADAVPLILLQCALVAEIGKIYGHKPDLNSAKEFLGVLGSGLLLRQGFRQLVKVVPGVGTGVSAAYAAAGTAAIGYAAMLWYEAKSLNAQQPSVGLPKPLGGGALSTEELRRVYRNSLRWFADSAKRGRSLLPPPNPKLGGMGREE